MIINLEEVLKKMIFDSEILLYYVKECRQCFFNNCERIFQERERTTTISVDLICFSLDAIWVHNVHI